MGLGSYRVGKHHLVECDSDDIDPRGILQVYEEPNPRATYVIGCDPTFGIAGWNRHIRTKDDAKVDNAAIEVFRVGGQYPDVQVAEWAAPLDAEGLAEICNFIGKLYAGADEDQQALMCIETYPGTGWMTQRELISRFGYTHLPPWLVENSLAMKTTHRLGWVSNRSTRQDLWTRGVAHLTKKMAILRSPWLIEEMADCTPDSFLAASGRARNGLHDDRVVAMLIALWYANEWTLNLEPTERSVVEDSSLPEYQATDLSYDRMMEEWSDRFDRLLDD